MLAVDHFFPPSNPALPSAPAKKSFSSVNSSILASSVLTSTVGPAVSVFASSPKTPVAPLKQLVFPLFDLVGVHIELLGQFHQRLLTSDGGERHFCLESRAVVPAVVSSWSLLFPASKPKSGRNSTYPRCADFLSHLFPTRTWTPRTRLSSLVGTAFAILQPYVQRYYPRMSEC